MTSVSERTQYVTWIREAKESGARLPLACEEAGISLRTYKRWYQNGKVLADKRPDAVRSHRPQKIEIYNGFFAILERFLKNPEEQKALEEGGRKLAFRTT